MNELQEEEEKLRKIINIVRPTTLPELKEPQVEENVSKEPSKVKSTINCNQLSVKPVIPVEVKITDEKKVKPEVKEKVKAPIDKEQTDIKEAEGIIKVIIIYVH